MLLRAAVVQICGDLGAQRAGVLACRAPPQTWVQDHRHWNPKYLKNLTEMHHSGGGPVGKGNRKRNEGWTEAMWGTKVR